ncbi:hypothetical protein D3C72_2410400 [compost metagenome]
MHLAGIRGGLLAGHGARMHHQYGDRRRRRGLLPATGRQHHQQHTTAHPTHDFHEAQDLKGNTEKRAGNILFQHG